MPPNYAAKLYLQIIPSNYSFKLCLQMMPLNYALKLCLHLQIMLVNLQIVGVDVSQEAFRFVGVVVLEVFVVRFGESVSDC